MQVCFYGLCSLCVCYIHKEQNKTSGPVIKSPLPVLLQILVTLGWKGYTPTLSLFKDINSRNINYDNFFTFCLCFRFMDNLQTEVLEIEFLSYSNGMNTISEEDFAHILLRYTNVENTSSYLENMRGSIPEEKVIAQQWTTACSPSVINMKT